MIIRYIIVPINRIGPNVSPEIPDLQFTHFFWEDNPYILFYSSFNLSTVATSLQWQLSSVPKVAVVEKFKCMWVK